ncbi:hypothetical protein DPMN_151657 [Dreissena polymorpha]|uniref:Uncharacterized protein n=1 Tax=Dreissena polymorpha TaxID=45954 RepID=A0A9D4J7J6_DREPO|nr:hypothetical protein DPMN_151657 [Dreissena polymorpha]
MITLLATGKLGNTELKGRTPSLSYADGIKTRVAEALRSRFDLSNNSKSVVNGTRTLSLSTWPVAVKNNMRGC